MNGILRARALTQLALHGIPDHPEQERFERQLATSASLGCWARFDPTVGAARERAQVFDVVGGPAWWLHVTTSTFRAYVKDTPPEPKTTGAERSVASGVVSAATGWTSIFAPLQMETELINPQPKLRVSSLAAAKHVDQICRHPQCTVGKLRHDVVSGQALQATLVHLDHSGGEDPSPVDGDRYVTELSQMGSRVVDAAIHDGLPLDDVLFEQRVDNGRRDHAIEITSIDQLEIAVLREPLEAELRHEVVSLGLVHLGPRVPRDRAELQFKFGDRGAVSITIGLGSHRTLARLLTGGLHD